MSNKFPGRNNAEGSTTLGEDTVGMDFKVFGDTTGKFFFWDASADTFNIEGDLKLFGTTSSKTVLFDASKNLLETDGIELNTRARFDLLEDFVMPTINETDFPVVLNSTGDANDPSIASNAAGGILTITSSTSDNETSQVVVSIPVSADKGGLVFETKLAISTDVENICVFAGLTDITTLEMPVEISGTTITTNASDAVGFVFDTDQTTDKWYAIGVAGDTDATGNALTDTAPTADTYQTLRIEVSEDGSTAYLYIDGVLKGTLTANALTAATSVYATVCIENRSAAANTALVDYIYVGHDR